MVRVILDTNVWSRLADRNQGDEFARFEEEHELEVIVPPSTLVEALRTPEPNARSRIVATMTTKQRIYPPPEAYAEAAELVGEIRRFKPEWLLKRPRTDRIPKLLKFWTKRVWQMARDDPEYAAASLTISDQASGRDRDVATLLSDAKENRQQILETGWDVPLNKINDLRIDLASADDLSRLGWEGDSIEPWRVDSANLFWYEVIIRPQRAMLRGADTTFADWTLPWVNASLAKADRPGWNRLFYYEAEAKAMPRNWIRTAVRYAQWGMKIGQGNPVDEQHATYLVGADVFLTGDRRFRDLLTSLAGIAPVPLADPRLVPADAVDVVEAIKLALT